MNYEVYILYSKKLDRYYVGQTENIDLRLRVHNTRGKKYTSKGIPWILIKSYKCNSRSEAVSLETKIKKRGIRRFIEDE
ncbi:GIY-YIG nuclease family protein [Eudoraea sp.]|uniref:GIY-YIG nuclease family protein n=1 Tax=Eudoraea sp. TaxID=1979955 RepID=UPI003C761E4F